MDSLKELEVKKQKTNVGKSKNCTTLKDKPDFKERKEISRNISKFEKQSEKRENEIENLEIEIGNMDELMSSRKILENNEIFEKYNNLKAKLEQEIEFWEKEQNELEYWQSKKNW